MAFCKKAGNLLGRVAGVSQEISSSTPSFFKAIRCMSTSKLFIKGLSPGTDDASVQDAFSKYGQVDEARVVAKRHKGRWRGFAFITYSSADEAAAVVKALNNEHLLGRKIKVNYANDRVRANEGEGGGFVGSHVSSGDKNSGGGGGKAATAAVEVPEEQEYYASKASGAGHVGGMTEVIFYYSSYYDDVKS